MNINNNNSKWQSLKMKYESNEADVGKKKNAPSKHKTEIIKRYTMDRTAFPILFRHFLLHWLHNSKLHYLSKLRYINFLVSLSVLWIREYVSLKTASIDSIQKERKATRKKHQNDVDDDNSNDVDVKSEKSQV